MSNYPLVIARLFDGEMSGELEVWLGNAFECWLPSTRQVIVRTTDGERIAREGAWLLKEESGEVRVAYA